MVYWFRTMPVINAYSADSIHNQPQYKSDRFDLVYFFFIFSQFLPERDVMTEKCGMSV